MILKMELVRISNEIQKKYIFFLLFLNKVNHYKLAVLAF